MVDGIGGTTKRLAHDFCRVPGNRITNQVEFAALVEEKTCKSEMWVMLANQTDMVRFRDESETKFSDNLVRPITNIQKSHVFRGENGNRGKMIVEIYHRSPHSPAIHNFGSHQAPVPTTPSPSISVPCTSAPTEPTPTTPIPDTPATNPPTPSKPDSEPSFRVSVGDIIVVAYEDGFDLAEVLRIEDKEYDVKKMEKVGGRFKWPSTTKRAKVHDNFVLEIIPDLSPTDPSLRLFKLENAGEISEKFTDFKTMYFDV